MTLLLWMKKISWANSQALEEEKMCGPILSSSMVVRTALSCGRSYHETFASFMHRPRYPLAKWKEVFLPRIPPQFPLEKVIMRTHDTPENSWWKPSFCTINYNRSSAKNRIKDNSRRNTWIWPVARRKDISSRSLASKSFIELRKTKTPLGKDGRKSSKSWTDWRIILKRNDWR